MNATVIRKNKTIHLGSRALRILVWTAAALTVGLLAAMIVNLMVRGLPHLKPSLFAWTYTSVNVSLLPAAVNTLVMTILALLIAVPAGIGAAIFTCEYATRGNRFVAVVRLAAETLAGIPSIVYGLFGAIFFVRQLGCGKSTLLKSIDRKDRRALPGTQVPLHDCDGDA